MNPQVVRVEQKICVLQNSFCTLLYIRFHWPVIELKGKISICVWVATSYIGFLLCINFV